MVKERVEKQLQCFNIKLEKTMINNDILIIDEDLANEDRGTQ